MGRKKNESAETVWRDRLARFDRSDLTVKQFCRREGVSDAAFYRWRRRLKNSGRRTKTTGKLADNRVSGTEAFVPVNVSATAFAEVDFPNGVRVRVPATNADALQVVLTAGNAACREVE